MTVNVTQNISSHFEPEEYTTFLGTVYEMGKVIVPKGTKLVLCFESEVHGIIEAPSCVITMRDTEWLVTGRIVEVRRDVLEHAEVDAVSLIVHGDLHGRVFCHDLKVEGNIGPTAVVKAYEVKVAGDLMEGARLFHGPVCEIAGEKKGTVLDRTDDFPLRDFMER